MRDEHRDQNEGRAQRSERGTSIGDQQRAAERWRRQRPTRGRLIKQEQWTFQSSHTWCQWGAEQRSLPVGCWTLTSGGMLNNAHYRWGSEHSLPVGCWTLTTGGVLNTHYQWGAEHTLPVGCWIRMSRWWARKQWTESVLKGGQFWNKDDLLAFKNTIQTHEQLKRTLS